MFASFSDWLRGLMGTSEFASFERGPWKCSEGAEGDAQYRAIHLNTRPSAVSFRPAIRVSVAALSRVSILDGFSFVEFKQV